MPPGAAAAGRREAGSSPPRRTRAPRHRGRAAAPPGNRRSSGRSPSTASGGRRRDRGGHPAATRSGAAESSACPYGVWPRRMRPSIANGIPRVPSTVSSGARQRSTAGTTSAICSSGDPSAASSRIDSATSSSEPRAPAPSRKRTAPSSGGLFGWGVGEEMPLEVRERGAAVLGCPRGELVDAAAGQRGEVFLRPPERRERGPAGLVRHRDGQLGAGGERLEEAPLRPGQVLEAVREDRPAVPGIDVRAQPLDGGAPEQVAVPEAEPVELLAIGRVEESEVTVELRRARAGRIRARRARPGASRRSPGSVRSDRARSAASGRAHAAPRGHAGRR